MRFCGILAGPIRLTFPIQLAVVLIAGGMLSPRADADDADVIVLRSRVFDIPFQMDASSSVSSVKLLVSSDQGKSWETAAEEQIPITKFHFEADADGEYWFAHSTDRSPVGDPPVGVVAERRIVIDSTGPEIVLTGESDQQGTVSANLRIRDPNQIATRRVLYATDVDRKWKTVSDSRIDREGGFEVRDSDEWTQMTIHVTATDSLGNVSVEAKTFRRPRIAAATPLLPDHPHQRLADANRLRIQTAAGPSDPPSLFLGPGPSATTGPLAYPYQSLSPTPNSVPPRLNQSGSFALQAPAGAANAPGSQGQVGSQIQQRLPSGAATTDRPYTSPYRMPTAEMPRPSTMTPSLTESGPPATPSDQPRTLPANGVVAKVTPQGVEAIPPATPEPEQALPPEAAAPNPFFNAPDTNTGVMPSTNPPGSIVPGLNVPNQPATNQRAPGDPITPSATTPSAANPSAVSPSTRFDAPATPQRPRTLADAMRPLGSRPSEPTGGTTPTNAAAPESIPTPASASAEDQAQRYRAERAEQISRDQQLRFDRAQMARNVPFRYSDSYRFSLEYELEAVGASGVDAVELYGSLDAGKTWKRWGADPDRRSPFDIETKGEGVFAFRIVVLGSNGLSSPRPLPGDTPDIAVVVDETKPTIKLTSARYGEGDRTGSLVIRYECSDENLMNRPVAIAFSDSLDGPWTTIAAGLRNDGLYVWPADPKLPPAIYLRIDATDQAGNTGSYLLDQPIATRGLAPRARILGFESR